MQIVIELSEQDYQLACKYPDVLIAVYAHVIKKGTPLPKGHGRLIDADELFFSMTDSIDQAIAEEARDEAPTIIEADKGGS